MDNKIIYNYIRLYSYETSKNFMKLFYSKRSGRVSGLDPRGSELKSSSRAGFL
jgi:hypothetical protein